MLMAQHPESTTQYSGTELEGGARDVKPLGEVIAALQLELPGEPNPASAQSRPAEGHAERSSDLRPRPPREAQ